MTSVSTPRNGPRMSVRHVLKSVGILPMLLGVILLFALLTPKFLTADNGINVARQASINLVLAAGMTFVILTRGIDLAAGSVLGVSAVISVMLSLTPVWTKARARTMAFVMVRATLDPWEIRQTPFTPRSGAPPYSW